MIIEGGRVTSMSINSRVDVSCDRFLYTFRAWNLVLFICDCVAEIVVICALMLARGCCTRYWTME